MLRDLFSLFPAYAGVIPVLCPGLIFFPAFPRIRGGDPMFNPKKVYSGRFSPHTRGGSLELWKKPRRELLFPAYAGVIPCPGQTSGTLSTFPRIRGAYKKEPRAQRKVK